MPRRRSRKSGSAASATPAVPAEAARSTIRSLPISDHVELYDRLQAATVASGPALARALATCGDHAGSTRESVRFGTLASMAYRHGSLPWPPGVAPGARARSPIAPACGRTTASCCASSSATPIRAGCGSRWRRATTIAARAVNLAETLVAERKDGEASQLLDAVLAKEPSHPEALGVKGRLLAAQGHTREALPYFEKATATSDHEPFIELARAYLAAGDPGKARATAAEALRRNPGRASPKRPSRERRW
jgi:tetratricopeptide (TPR) repeat protein